MICPSCNTANTLTWKKYFLSPLGRHRCENCQASFKIKHQLKYYLSITALAALLLAPIVAVQLYLDVDTLQALLLYLLLVLVVVMPIDKKMDDAWCDKTLPTSHNS